MIINIQNKDFGGKLRNGDMLGVCNIIEYMRKQENNKDIKMYVEDNCIQQEIFGIKFREFLKQHSDYFSDVPGENYFNFDRLNLWDFRSITNDNIVIDNSEYKKENKICIFPIFDAPYNVYRNWSIALTNSIIDKYRTLFPDYRVYICVAENLTQHYSKLNLENVNLSFDFDENLNHICTTKVFIGGDTGSSHLAGSLSNPAINFYYYSCEGLIHTLPLNYKKNGSVKMYSRYGCDQ